LCTIPESYVNIIAVLVLGVSPHLLHNLMNGNTIIFAHLVKLVDTHNLQTQRINTKRNHTHTTATTTTTTTTQPYPPVRQHHGSRFQSSFVCVWIRCDCGSESHSRRTAPTGGDGCGTWQSTIKHQTTTIKQQTTTNNKHNKLTQWRNV
jgi:hypothetical protein